MATSRDCKGGGWRVTLHTPFSQSIWTTGTPVPGCPDTRFERVGYPDTRFNTSYSQSIWAKGTRVPDEGGGGGGGEERSGRVVGGRGRGGERGASRPRD